MKAWEWRDDRYQPILSVVLMSVQCGDCEKTSETSQWQGSAVAGEQIGDNSTGGTTVKQGDKKCNNRQQGRYPRCLDDSKVACGVQIDRTCKFFGDS